MGFLFATTPVCTSLENTTLHGRQSTTLLHYTMLRWTVIGAGVYRYLLRTRELLSLNWRKRKKSTQIHQRTLLVLTAR